MAKTIEEEVDELQKEENQVSNDIITILEEIKQIEVERAENMNNYERKMAQYILRKE